MNRISRFALPLAFAAALTIGACSGDADIDVNTDTTAVDDTVTLTPADTGLSTNADNNSTAGSDTTNAVGDAAGGAQNETVEKMVEAQLMVAPGFANVSVESEGDGVIVLTGAVATSQEKTDAETEAKKVAGVNSVRNEITVKQ